MKAKSSQSPQLSRVTCTSAYWPIDSSEPDSKQEEEAVDPRERHDVGSSDPGVGASDISAKKVEFTGQVSSLRPPHDDFQPYIEVGLQDCEIGLFLKICRTLKAICTTKLKAVPEQKKVTRRNSLRSLSALWRTGSGHNVETDVAVD